MHTLIWFDTFRLQFFFFDPPPFPTQKSGPLMPLVAVKAHALLAHDGRSGPVMPLVAV
jgi:hypothetical protein